MFYQLRANLFFHDLDAIDDIKDKILDHFDNSTIINPDSENSEFSTLEIISNHHDEDPNSPCDTILELTNKPQPPL